MNKHIKKLWVAELRNPNIKQTSGQLRTGTGAYTAFCCLGVLCNLHAAAHPKIAAAELSPYTYLNERGCLPQAVIDWAGIPSIYGDEVIINGKKLTLAEHNDSGATFIELAAAIQAQL